MASRATRPRDAVPHRRGHSHRDRQNGAVAIPKAFLSQARDFNREGIKMTEVVVVVGSGSIGQAIARQGRARNHVLLAALLAVLGCARAEPPVPAGRAEGGVRVLRPATVVTSDSAMVVSASPYATNAGLAVLRSGGNAVD